MYIFIHNTSSKVFYSLVLELVGWVYSATNTFGLVLSVVTIVVVAMRFSLEEYVISIE